MAWVFSSAKAAHLVADLVLDETHDAASVGREHVQQVHVAEDPAQGRGHHGVEPAADAFLARASGLKEPERVDDAVASEAVDGQAALVGQNDLFATGVEVEQPVVELEHGLDEGNLSVQAGLFDDADGLAELGDEHLFRL